MKVYIAGPYTQGNTFENVETAVRVGNTVANLGHIPFIPHLYHFWNRKHEHDYDFWMRQGRQWLLSCDAILRLDGKSPGADKEMTEAMSNGLRIVTLDDLRTMPVCRDCGGQLQYVQSVIEVHDIEEMPDEHGYVNLEFLVQSHVNDDFDTYLLCSVCGQKHDLKGTPK